MARFQMNETVLTIDDGGVCVITQNRPARLNAINPALLDGLNAALARANAGERTGAIVLTDAGRAFCAGGDLVDQRSMLDADEAAIAGFVLRHAGVRAVVTMRALVPLLLDVRADIGAAFGILCVDGDADGESLDFAALVEAHAADAPPAVAIDSHTLVNVQYMLAPAHQPAWYAMRVPGADAVPRIRTAFP